MKNENLEALNEYIDFLLYVCSNNQEVCDRLYFLNEILNIDNIDYVKNQLEEITEIKYEQLRFIN